MTLTVDNFRTQLQGMQDNQLGRKVKLGAEGELKTYGNGFKGKLASWTQKKTSRMTESRDIRSAFMQAMQAEFGNDEGVQGILGNLGTQSTRLSLRTVKNTIQQLDTYRQQKEDQFLRTGEATPGNAQGVSDYVNSLGGQHNPELIVAFVKRNLEGNESEQRQVCLNLLTEEIAGSKEGTFLRGTTAGIKLTTELLNGMTSEIGNHVQERIIENLLAAFPADPSPSEFQEQSLALANLMLRTLTTTWPRGLTTEAKQFFQDLNQMGNEHTHLEGNVGAKTVIQFATLRIVSPLLFKIAADQEAGLSASQKKGIIGAVKGLQALSNLLLLDGKSSSTLESKFTEDNRFMYDQFVTDTDNLSTLSMAMNHLASPLPQDYTNLLGSAPFEAREILQQGKIFDPDNRLEVMKENVTELLDKIRDNFRFTPDPMLQTRIMDMEPALENFLEGN